MAANLSGQTSDSTRRARIFGRVRLLFTLGLLVLLVLCLAFSWSTRDAMAHLPFLKGSSGAGRPAANHNTLLVDLRPWQTAQALAALAVTSEEIEYAREAQRYADHEVDQAFAAALREAGMKQYSLSGEALALSKKIAQLQQTVDEDQARVALLTKAAEPSASSVTGRAAPAADTDDLDVAKAQLDLEMSELADAQQDLARAGGDERGRIQQELSAHEATMKEYDAQAANPGSRQGAVVSAGRSQSVVTRLDAWLDQRTRYQLVQEAIEQTQSDAAALTVRHAELETRANTVPSASPVDSSPDKAAKLATLENRSAQSQLLGIYDDRIQSQGQLAAVYRKWSAQLLLQHRIMLHLLLQSVALIAFILICVILFDALVRHLVDRPSLDRRRMHTLRTVLKLGIQFTGFVLILLVVFGVPNQMPTILGLTTAGLTVVLQDFIIAFFGWFVLMGRSGIRVGDWVEINGVAGEVVEVGIFRTALLETDKGHPTGRRITFINSFTIKGQYFNFSTTSQWMWDEIRFGIPTTGDARDIIETIHKAVLEETEENARLAEAEWKSGARKNSLSQLSAGPAVEIRPGGSGMDIVVRYVTRASDRFDMRNRLYERVIALLRKPPMPAA
jgi:small-conductance mechanosensitive channel